MSVDVTLKVSAKSNPNAVAGALAAVTARARDLRAPGCRRGRDQSGDQSRCHRAQLPRGAQLDLVCTPSFVVVAIGESERTAISLLVKRHKLEEKVAS